MIPTTNKFYRFLDDYGTQEMFNILLEVSEHEFDKRIVNDLSEEYATEDNIPSAAFIHKMLKQLCGEYNSPAERIDAMQEFFNSIQLKVDICESREHLSIELVNGPLSTISIPRPSVMYIQRDDPTIKSWNIYIYSEELVNGEHWIGMGDFEPDLVSLWKKDQINELKQALGISDNVEYVPLTSSYITGRVNLIFDQHKPEEE